MKRLLFALLVLFLLGALAAVVVSHLDPTIVVDGAHWQADSASDVGEAIVGLSIAAIVLTAVGVFLVVLFLGLGLFLGTLFAGIAFALMVALLPLFAPLLIAIALIAWATWYARRKRAVSPSPAGSGAAT